MHDLCVESEGVNSGGSVYGSVAVSEGGERKQYKLDPEPRPIETGKYPESSIKWAE